MYLITIRRKSRNIEIILKSNKKFFYKNISMPIEMHTKHFLKCINMRIYEIIKHILFNTYYSICGLLF